jgi:hypothetical protein
MLKPIRYLALIVAFLVISPAIYAELYNTISAGDRAMGLGGAYTAISDDASGIVYNPGGIVDAASDSVSGSVNTFQLNKTATEDPVEKRQMVVNSTGLTSFFGSIKHLKNKDLTLGFSVHVPENESIDQYFKLGKSEVYGLERTNVDVKSDLSTVKAIGAASGYISDTTSVGISLGFVRQKLSQLQSMDFRGGLEKSDDIKTDEPLFIDSTGRNRQELLFHALEIGIGVVERLNSNTRVGAYVNGGWILSQEQRLIASRTEAITREDGTYITPDDVNNPELMKINSAESQKVNDPLQRYPVKIHLGFAWKANEGQLLSLDAKHIIPRRTTEDLVREVPRTNFALGYEYFITPEVPIRTGLFTNFSTDPTISGKLAPVGRKHTDLYALSLFSGYVDKQSSFTFGVIYEAGIGKSVPFGTNDEGLVNKSRTDILILSLGVTSSVGDDQNPS